jgi:hypothetical protein
MYPSAADKMVKPDRKGGGGNFLLTCNFWVQKRKANKGFML